MSANLPKLSYRPGDRFYPIPPSEQGLPSVVAEHFVDIPMDGVAPGHNLLEGLCFSRAGDLYLTHVVGQRIYKVDVATREVSLFAELPDGMKPAALKFHKDGRAFLAIAYSDRGGMVAILSPEGELEGTILEGCGQTIDDLVFDELGGFYYTCLDGTPQDPCAGVFYCEPDLRTVHTLTTGMIESNGIALTPDGKGLWVTEYGRSQLWFLKVPRDRHTLGESSTRIPYKFAGVGSSDSCSVDADGNLYVALCGQGRYLAFNANGMPIGQFLMPGRAEGAWLRTTHPALRPGTDELYMSAADFATGKSAIFVARGFAQAHRSYQFQ